ncbi:MAG TPA: VOC family protein [Planctomycetota bacterium]|nr:VOC family protein [Planctomycetota bacterium]
MTVKPVPDGYRTLTPCLVVDGVARFLDFLQKAFDAVVVERVDGDGGKVRHAEVRIGDSMLMMGDAMPQWPAAPGSLYMYVPDCDAVFRRAVDAGATVLVPPTNHFYGDRNGGVKDPFGNTWWIATHVEDVPKDELLRRAAAGGKG